MNHRIAIISLGLSATGAGRPAPVRRHVRAFAHWLRGPTGSGHRPRTALFALACAVPAIVFLAPVSASAHAPGCLPPEGPALRLAGIDSFGDLRLDDGRVLRLAGLAVPADGTGQGEATLRAALASLVGQDLRVTLLTEQPDRHGRFPALLATDVPAIGETSLNARLVMQGLAVVRPEPGLGACLEVLMAAEVAPRRARRGLWASLPLPVWDVAALSARAGRFTLLAGRVLSVGKGRAVDYLNFGRVWRKDTTLRLEKTGRAALEQVGLAPQALAGQTVLARGVIHEAGGPAITVESAAQLVRLDAADRASWDEERDGRRTGTW